MPVGGVSFAIVKRRVAKTNQRLAVAYHQCEALYIIRNQLRYIVKPQGDAR
jgi:hypothetical protein